MSITLPPLILHEDEAVVFEIRGEIIHVHLMSPDEGRRAFSHTEMTEELIRHNPQAAAELIRADLDMAIKLLKQEHGLQP